MTSQKASSREDFIKDLWRRSVGLPPLMVRRMKLNDLERTQWSREFERLMRNRLAMGAYRYGPIGHPEKPQYARVEAMIAYLEEYRAGGNLERLVDVANICMVEFHEGDQPNRHFTAMDESKHVEVIN